MIETRKKYISGNLRVFYKRKQTETGDWHFIVSCESNQSNQLFEHTFLDPDKAIKYFNSICVLVDKLLWFTPEYAINSIVSCED